MAQDRKGRGRPRLDGKLRDDRFYARLGFRCGLEIHQQLLTKGKLYCRCPAGLYSERHDTVILRQMRPTLSELGEYDGTALMEFKTNKEVVYLLDSATVCTYEMDDTPPFPPDDEAIDIALSIMLMLRCRPVGEMHIIRKQYLDGSIPTGFQRTAILGVEGSVPFGKGEIGIYQLAIEEDSCREVSDIGHRITWRTDRLSMPLIEVVTKPEMRTPDEAAEVAGRIARLTRATGKVRRGIGSARQDVNVSIEGGTRVEIKGVPRIPLIPRLTHNEALRQLMLLAIRETAIGFGITQEQIGEPDQEVTDLFAETRVPALRETIRGGGEIRAVRLPVFQAFLRTRVQPGIPFAQEFSGRIRVIACLDQPVNLFIRGERFGFGLFRHHENPTLDLPAPGVRRRGPSPEEWHRVAARLGAAEEDGILLVHGPHVDTLTAAEEIRIRAREALDGVPSETRQPFSIGTTDFERILPGPNRMYPDTDLPPIDIKHSRLEAIAATLPHPPWIREERYVEWGVDRATAVRLAVSARAARFERAVEEIGVPAKEAARFYQQTWRHLVRRGAPIESIPEGEVDALLAEIARGELKREGVASALVWMAVSERGAGGRPRGGAEPAEEELRSMLAPWCEDARRDLRAAPTKARLVKLAMQIAMSRLAGRVAGSRVRPIIESLVEKDVAPEGPST